MDERDKWRVRVRKIRASGTLWKWWWLHLTVCLNCVLMRNWIVWNRAVYLYKMDLALNNLYWLICHKNNLIFLLFIIPVYIGFYRKIMHTYYYTYVLADVSEPTNDNFPTFTSAESPDWKQPIRTLVSDWSQVYMLSLKRNWPNDIFSHFLVQTFQHFVSILDYASPLCNNWAALKCKHIFLIGRIIMMTSRQNRTI